MRHGHDRNRWSGSRPRAAAGRASPSLSSRSPWAGAECSRPIQSPGKRLTSAASPKASNSLGLALRMCVGRRSRLPVPAFTARSREAATGGRVGMAGAIPMLSVSVHHTGDVCSTFVEVLPRTRGFTDRRPRVVCAGRGSSAHARVHRSSRGTTATRSRFFRARAGSPWPWLNCVGLFSVLPRTRGFTPDASPDHAGHGGSSAHARVHRRRRKSMPGMAGFFRARAGSPTSTKGRGVQYPGGSSAHARVHRRCCRPGAGPGRSFAHARVHRALLQASRARYWLFRARAGSSYDVVSDQVLRPDDGYR